MLAIHTLLQERAQSCGEKFGRTELSREIRYRHAARLTLIDEALTAFIIPSEGIVASGASLRQTGYNRRGERIVAENSQGC